MLSDDVDFKKLIKLLENILRIRSARGTNHPVKNRAYKQPYGRSQFEADDVKELPPENKLVDISRAFKGRRDA